MKKGVVRLAAILLPIIVLLVMESCARTVITLRQDFTPPPVAPKNPHGLPSRELGWEGYRDLDTAQKMDPTIPRIVAIGDSNTWGYGVEPQAAWPAVLNRALRHAVVLNMGTLGYSSFQGYGTLRKYGERLHASAIVASFNYNDRAYVYGPNVDSEEKFGQIYDAQKKGNRYEWLNKIYMTRVIRYIGRKIGLIRPDPRVNIDVRDLEARVPPKNYAENLRRIVQYGRERNIPVIFILLKDNPHYTRHIRAGIEYRGRGNYERAVRAFNIGLTNTVSGTLSRKYLAQTYEAMGNKEKAVEVGHMEGVLRNTISGASIYLDQDYNDLMIQVGHELGVKVVDARPMLDADPDMFLDMCHPDEVGHARIAQLVLAALEEVAPALAKDAVPISPTVADRKPAPERFQTVRNYAGAR